MTTDRASLTPAQCRAARGLINISQVGLAEEARLSRHTVYHFENGTRKPGLPYLASMREAFEAAGVCFIDRGRFGQGVGLRRLNNDEPSTLLTPGLCRAARGLLDISQTDLADLSEVSRDTINIFEVGKHRPPIEYLVALRAALEVEGVTFLGEGEQIIGVCRRHWENTL